MDTLFASYPGGNCTINGASGYVTALHKEGPHTVGAFVYVPPDDAAGTGQMLFVRLGRTLAEGRREVSSVRVVSRDEFDRITTLDKLRHDLGWRP